MIFKLWNKKEIEKEWKKLNVPKKYETMRCDIDVLLNHDITMLLSVREDSGKTTQALLYGLILNKLYNTHMIYMRSDTTQIAVGKVRSLFDTIIACGYIEKITDGKYNTVEYKQQQHKFYLAKMTKDNDGNIYKDISDEFFCHVIAAERYIDYKSTVNDPYADYMIYDEFMDTERSTQNQMIELMNNISTFFRPGSRQVDGKPLGHCLMLGNNTNKYSHWFEEFCIENDIDNLKFGSYIDKTTEKGTTFACYLLQQSHEFKEKVVKNKIHFFGFNTPKMNAFNGLNEWQADAYAHIPSDDYLKESKLITKNLYIKHRNRYIKLEIYSHDHSYFIFAHYDKKLYSLNKSIVFTLTPEHKNEVYGFGNFVPNVKIRNKCKIVSNLIKSNCIYFASNSVGDLFSNYCKEFRKNTNFLI